jgi:hypothetical protein
MTYQHRSLIDRFYIEDDLIREVWVLGDVYSLIRQLDPNALT